MSTGAADTCASTSQLALTMLVPSAAERSRAWSAPGVEIVPVTPIVAAPRSQSPPLVVSR